MQCQYSSTPVHAGETRELGNLEDNTKFVGPNEQATKEVEVVVEGEEVTDVQCIHSRPVSSLHSFAKAIPARTNYEVARCCEVLVDNDVNVWRAKEELSV